MNEVYGPQIKFVTANIMVNPEYLKNNPDVIKKFLEAHVNETQWINGHKEEALKTFNFELKKPYRSNYSR